MANEETQRGSCMILAIPPEIQTYIIRLLVPSSIESVHAVCYTCKRLYEVALPLSVHTYQNPHPGEIRRPRSRSRNLDFLRYVTIVKPGLARYVKSIILDSFTTYASLESDRNVLQPVGATGDDMRAYSDLLFDMSSRETNPIPYNWQVAQAYMIHGIWSGIEDAEVALLLVVCSGLEYLAFGQPIAPRILLRLVDAAVDFHRASQIPGSVSGPIKLLSCLRSVYHESEGVEPLHLGFSRLSEMFFQLPQIRSYECILADTNSETYIADIPKGSSPIEHIALRKSHLTPDMLQALLRACKSLRSFEYIRGELNEIDDEEIRPRDLMAAILIHAESLESLHVNFEYGWQMANWAEGEEIKEELAMGGAGLQRMMALKSLTVGMPALTGMTLGQIDDDEDTSSNGDSSSLEMELTPTLVQCLPKNLESLQIHSCGPQILLQAQELLDAVSAGERFQRLKRIRFLFEEEQICHSVMALTCSKPDVLVEVITQTLQNREFDHVPYAMRSTKSLADTFMCSPMSTRGDRELWLKYRGSDQGSADPATGRVYEVPDA